MEKVFLAILKDIWLNKSRSFIVILSLVSIICFPIAFLNVSPNMENIMTYEENEFNLAHFNIFFDTYYENTVKDNISRYIENFLSIDKTQYVVESRIFESSKMRSEGLGDIPEGSWIDLDVMAINQSSPNYISALKLEKGDLPNNSQELVMLDSLAELAGLDIGDVVTLFQKGGETQFRISGLVKSVEYSNYELSQSGAIYISYEGMERLTNRAGLELITNEISIYFEYEISMEDLEDLSEFLKDQLREDGINVVLFWFVRETSFRLAVLDALKLTSEYMYSASMFMFLVAGVIIYIVTNRYVNEQKKRIGALYSFGVRKNSIILALMMRIFILAIISTIFGLLFAQWILNYMVQLLAEEWGLIGFSNSLNLQTVVFTLISTHIVTYVFTYLAVTNLRKLTPYEAMRGRTNELKNSGVIFKFSRNIPIKIIRNAVKNLTRNRTRSLLTILAFTVAMTFSGSLLYAEQSVGRTIEDFYDKRIYYDVEVELGFDIIGNPLSEIDESISNLSEVKKSEYFVNSLVQMSGRPDKLTFMLGVYHNTSMYDLSDDNLLDGRWFTKNSSEVVISRYIQGTIGVNLGDSFDFEFFGLKINTTVVGITNDIQFSSSFFIDFDYLNDAINNQIFEITNQKIVIANKLLLLLEDPLIKEEFQDNLNTNNKDVIIALTQYSYQTRSAALSESQTAIIYVLVTMGLIAAAVSIFTTMLISVIERQRELALLEIFGYRKYELIIAILFEGWIMGTVAIYPMFKISQFVAENLWTKIISDNIYQIFPIYPTNVSYFLIIFGYIMITISIIPAFYISLKTKIAELIREE